MRRLKYVRLCEFVVTVKRLEIVSALVNFIIHVWVQFERHTSVTLPAAFVIRRDSTF